MNYLDFNDDPNDSLPRREKLKEIIGDYLSYSTATVFYNDLKEETANWVAYHEKNKKKASTMLEMIDGYDVNLHNPSFDIVDEIVNDSSYGLGISTDMVFNLDNAITEENETN